MLNDNEYLKKILEDQVLSDEDLNTLKEKRNDVTNFLRSKFPQASIRWAGSVAKSTIIKESYDADTTCYFPCDKNDTLQEIYREVGKALEDNYKVDYKTSALRIKDKHQWQNDWEHVTLLRRIIKPPEILLPLTRGCYRIRVKSGRIGIKALSRLDPVQLQRISSLENHYSLPRC